jgi:hypothetical protein
MEEEVQKFCDRLSLLVPKKSHGLVAELYELVELLDDDNDISPIYKLVFTFFENYPDADVGNPGPLVHLLESKYPAYMTELVESLENKPTYMTVFMLSRVLNSKLPESDRSRYMSLLKEISERETANEMAVQNAKEVYECQLEGS